DLAELRDEDGDRVALSFYGGNRTDVDGSYALKGAASTLASHISAGVVASTITAITAMGGGSLYLLTVGSDENHDRFGIGDFTAVACSGITT
ncbi:MAG: hypothetical protein ACREQF_09530, partial [Candidatus Binataceae bacterium]